jgi:hypothetical protein
MMPESNGHQNQPPRKEEALQYITYSAKELLYMLNEKVDSLDQKIDEMKIHQAALDARYVSQEQWKDAIRESAVSKRFAVASAIASVGAFGSFVGLLIGKF